MTTKKSTLVWTPLADCPNNQLERLSDNKYALVCSTKTVIKAREDFVKWVDLGLYNEVMKDIDVLDISGALQIDQGIRQINKYLIEFTSETRRNLVKLFNSSSMFSSYSEIPQGFILPNHKDIDVAFLKEVEGVSKVSLVSILQRKEYKPYMLPTGIGINGNLPWHLITQSNPYKPYKLATHTVQTMPQVLVPVHSFTEANYTIIPVGEVIAEIGFIINNKEITLVREQFNKVANV